MPPCQPDGAVPAPTLHIPLVFLGLGLPSSFSHKTTVEASLVVQWLRLRSPNAGGPGSILGQGTESHMPQLRVHTAQIKSTCCNEDREQYSFAPSDACVRSFPYLLYTLIKLYYTHTHTHTHTQRGLRRKEGADPMIWSLRGDRCFLALLGLHMVHLLLGTDLHFPW